MEENAQQYRLLVTEDDNDINRLLCTILTKAGYLVTSAFSGTEAKMHLEMKEFDLLILDLMLPGMSGEELIAYVRQESMVPILVLTAKGALEDKVQVLEDGADDYVTKPFEPKELLARVGAQLRRSRQLAPLSERIEKREPVLKIRDLVLDPEELTVKVKGKAIELTTHEFGIMQVMLENPKKVFSKEALYEAVWKNGYYGEDNTVSVHVSNIRKKIAAVSEEEYIKTVWGIGYRLHL